jgi:tRNA G18 (ribose-2'-O)-methylase SpoU
VPVYVCDAADFRGLAGYDVHRGCLALAARPAPSSADAVVRDARLVVVLEGVTNPDNVGGVFRNAAAFGADAVLLDAASCDPLYRKAIRTSMGAVLSVPFSRIADWPDGLADVKATGFTIVALTPRQPSATLDEFAQSGRPARVALLVGTEGEGLSDEALMAADERVRIPITGAVDSLNLAVATGIVLARLSQMSSL